MKLLEKILHLLTFQSPIYRLQSNSYLITFHFVVNVKRCINYITQGRITNIYIIE